MRLRTAGVDDLDALLALEREAYPTDAWSAAMMREELGSPHAWYRLAEEAGRLAGYVGLRAPRGATDADIQTLTVAEAFRGSGRGRALLTAALEEAVRRGVHDVYLEVRDDNPVAQRLYASEGFVEVGRRPRYYQPDDVDAIVMKLDVRGWTAARVASLEAAPSALSEDRTEVGGSGSHPPTKSAFSDIADAAGLRMLGGPGVACDVRTGVCS